MGKRLHSAIKYEVKYETNGRFNWGGDHVNPIIECLAEGRVVFQSKSIVRMHVYREISIMACYPRYAKDMVEVTMGIYRHYGF